MKRWALVLLLIIFLASTTARALAATYTVTIDETKFVPSTLKIKQNDSITFINTTTATQSAKTSSTTGFNTGNIGPGASKTVTLATAGTFTYTSAYNSALSGTVTVEGATATTTESTASASPTATASATTTKGGDLPVSGTTEVLVFLLSLGSILILTGLFTNRFEIATKQTVIEIPPVSPYNDRDEA